MNARFAPVTRRSSSVISSMYCWSTAASSWISSKFAIELVWGTSTKPSRSRSVVNDRAFVIHIARPGRVRIVERSSASVTNSRTSSAAAGGFRM